MGEQDMTRQFFFDQVFPPDTSQETVYNTVAYRLVEDVLQGINGTLLCYGQTGTGKVWNKPSQTGASNPLRVVLRPTRWAS